jgi:AraC family transcriptional regulator of adaptative response / DNA-3-methyladenine glycosylase II
MLTDKICERARLARDSRFDGQFYVAVRTTGIYCRPVCPANLPKRENVTFFPTAAAAGEAGFRPCLRCRPECAPGSPAWRGTSTTVRRGLRLISRGALDNDNVETLASRLGVTSRHLHRLFTQHVGASPLAVAHTQRIQFAKRLIDETGLPMTHISAAAGYGSTRRFNDAFRKTYGRTPRELRNLRRNIEPCDQTAKLKVRLYFRRPFRWSPLATFFSARAIPGVEAVKQQTYYRTVVVNNSHGIIEVSPDKQNNYLSLSLYGIHTDALFEAVQTTRDMLDLDAPVTDIGKMLRQDETLAKLLHGRSILRVPGCWDGFELTVRAILGQQISVKAATTLAGRIAAKYGEPLNVPQTGISAGLERIFPTPEKLMQARLSGLGIIGSRADTIRRVARAVANQDINFDPAQDPEDFCARIKTIKGIGDWTAQYIAMRALKNPDAFPAADLGLLKALARPDRITPAQLSSRAEKWRPWRAYAAMMLWNSALDTGE